MAGPYGSDDAAVSYGGTAMTTQITEAMPTVDQANATEDATPMGSTVVQNVFTGLTDYGQITIGGIYNEAAGGCDLVFGAAARNKTTGALIITYGGGKTTTFSLVGVANYRRIIVSKAVTKYECVLFLATGCTVTEA